MDRIAFRNAEEKDLPLILQFIKELAAYEKMCSSSRIIAEKATGKAS